MQDAIRIEVMSGPEALRRGLVPGIDAIFFATALRVYPPGPERDAFRERWLGRFLEAENDVVVVALDAGDRVVGYLAGTLENAAESRRFADMPHFKEHFATSCAQYPAHLHINLAESHRNRGLGARMIEAFVACVRNAGLPGLHVTTGRGMRNVGFYLQCGFREIAALERNGGAMVFLGRKV